MLTNLRPRITRSNLPLGWIFAIAAIVLMLAPASGTAQRLAHAFPTLPDPFAQPATVNSAAVFGHPDDHRWEGAIVGGAFLGLLTGAVAAGIFCGDADSGGAFADCMLYSFTGFLIGATVGGGVGWLIGSGMPKEAR